jgi:hypothetical protein
MNLWQTPWEIELLVVHRMVEGKFDELKFRKYLLQLDTHKLVEAVVVVDMKEAAADQVLTKILCLLLVEDYVAMAGHIYIGVQEDILTSCFNYVFLGGQGGAKLLVAEPDQVRQGGLVGVPVASSAVFEFGDFQGGLATDRRWP